MGEIPEDWIEQVNYNYEQNNRWYSTAREVAAAQAAMQNFLPQHQKSRLTFSGASVGNTSGVGIGYAYMLDDKSRTALTLSVGHSGDETAVRGSIGFEFGGDRRIEIPRVVPEPVPTGMLLIGEDEYEELQLMAENSEEVEEHFEQAETRYAQQQSLIEELQEDLEEHEDNLEELDRLKREAAALRAKQEEDEARRQAVLDKYAEKGEK
jgi:hypothetical protein